MGIFASFVCSCGNCFPDVLGRLKNKVVLWEERCGQYASGDSPVQFSGVPFIILGWQVLECTFGEPKKQGPGSRRAVSNVVQ